MAMIIVIAFLLILQSAWLANAGVGCGRQHADYPVKLPPSKTARIVGGGIAQPHSWPWQVSLRRPDGSHFCGGTIQRIRDDLEESDIILTASHCLPWVDGKFGGQVDDFTGYYVVAGSQNRNSPAAGEQSWKVSKVIPHEKFSPNLGDDVALLLLEKPIQFSDTIRPPCMPKDGQSLPVGQTCVATGWGRDQSLDIYHLPDELKQALAPVLSESDCKSKWGAPASGSDFDSAFLCGGVLDGSSSVCNGDSGGPLVCKQSDGSWTQFGVAGFVHVIPVPGNPRQSQCNSSNSPPVFARLPNYMQWIREKIDQLTTLKA